MCGVLGIVSWGNHPRDPSRLSVASLKNRGPDNIGYHGDAQVGLYHTRLAIIDRREASNQPLISPCGRYALVCNGEIYNHDAVRRRYPYEYRTTSDCEVILACYAADGIQGFRALKGMFAFGLYDRARQRLIVCRDAVGKKPLFTYQDAGIFLFASSVTAITDNVPGALGLDPEAVASYLRDGSVRPTRALYRGVAPVLPGTVLELDVATGRGTRHALVPETTGPRAETAEAIAHEAERLLDDSIAQRVRGIEHPVLLFSGGIDSTVLAKKILTAAGGGSSASRCGRSCR